jgi:hypothetical protein
MTLRTLLATVLTFGMGAGALMLWPEPGYERVLPRAEAASPALDQAPDRARVMPAAAAACSPALPAPKPQPEI